MISCSKAKQLILLATKISVSFLGFVHCFICEIDLILTTVKQNGSTLRKRLRIRSVISVIFHYITVLCPFNLFIRFKCYNTVQNKFKQNINKYILHVLSIKLRYSLYFSFSIPTPGFPHFYYMLGANQGYFYTEKFP